MLDRRWLWSLALRVPRFFSGAALHRAGLEAMHAGEFDAADRLLETAAARYRLDVAVEPLARLRVHQLIARVRSHAQPEAEAALVLAIDRLLSRLDRIEALSPPFDLVDSHALLAAWLSDESPASFVEPPLAHVA